VDLKLPGWAPADSMFAIEVQLDPSALRGAAEDMAVVLMGEAGRQVVAGQLQQPIGGSPVTGEQILAGLADRVMVSATMPQGGMVDGRPMFVGCAEHGGDLLRQLRPMLEQMPDAGMSFADEADGRLTATSVDPASGAVKMVLQAAPGAGGPLYVASSAEYLAQVRDGKVPTLGSDPRVAPDLDSMPKKGASMSYISPDYYKFFGDMMQQGWSVAAADSPYAAIAQTAFADYLAQFDQPQVAVGFFTEDGMKSICYSDQSIEAALFVVPLGVMSAMAIPAFNHVRETSQNKVATNNLRQLAAAADQYRIDTGDMDDVPVSEIVGPGKYINELTPNAGEMYPDVIPSHGHISATFPDGRVIYYPFDPEQPDED
jgi:type IV pilus assembly protein PilA